jgi:hypothetical protein
MTMLTEPTTHPSTEPRTLIPPSLFDRLVVRVMTDDHTDRQRAERITDQALAFLLACALNPGAGLAPSEQVDAGWHAFLLHTREYATFCEQVAGRFIHHRPTDPGEAQPAHHTIGATLAAMRAAGLHVDAELWVPNSKCSQCYQGCADDPKAA